MPGRIGPLMDLASMTARHHGLTIVAVTPVVAASGAVGSMANVATPALYDRGLKYIWGTPFPVVPNWSARYFDMLGKVSPKPQTIIFITHDMGVVAEMADEIVVMAAGQIVERGTFRSLLAQNGRFAEMWRLQQESETPAA